MWEGSVEECLQTIIAPEWPDAVRVAEWTEAALAWHQRPESLLLIRGSNDKGWLHLEQGRQVVSTDNSPGIWSLQRAREGTVDPAHWSALMAEGTIPVLMARAKGDPERPWDYARTALSPRDANLLWSQSSKLCHIFDLRRSRELSLQQLSLRNLSLLNYFVFPNGHKHFHTERIGWSEPGNPSDLGESATVCAFAFHALAQKVEAVAPGLTRRFLVAAGEVMPVKPDGHLRIRIRPRQGIHPEQEHSPPSIAKAAQEGARYGRPSAPQNGHESWNFVFDHVTPLPAGPLLARHPHAQAYTQELLLGLTTARIVAIANALYNTCRPARLGEDEGAPARAWLELLARKDRPYDRQDTKWGRLITRLGPMPDSAREHISRMDILQLASLSSALIQGPYRTS